MSNINQRLSKLEANQPGDDGPDNLVIHLDWEDDDSNTYEVDGERMSRAEFRRRWPNYVIDSSEFEVNVSWDPPQESE
jgi:hypothetical protein